MRNQKKNMKQILNRTIPKKNRIPLLDVLEQIKLIFNI